MISFRYSQLSIQNNVYNNYYGLLLTNYNEENTISGNYFTNNVIKDVIDDSIGDNVWSGNYYSDNIQGSIYYIPGLSDSIDFNALISESDPPILTSPDDITYTEDTQFHTIKWSGSDIFPDKYFLFLNGTLIDSNIWYNEIPLVIRIDNLKPGHYNFTLQVFDLANNSAVDTVFVTVMSQTVSSNVISTVTTTVTAITSSGSSSTSETVQTPGFSMTTILISIILCILVLSYRKQKW